MICFWGYILDCFVVVVVVELVVCGYANERTRDFISEKCLHIIQKKIILTGLNMVMTMMISGKWSIRNRFLFMFFSLFFFAIVVVVAAAKKWRQIVDIRYENIHKYTVHTFIHPTLWRRCYYYFIACLLVYSVCLIQAENIVAYEIIHKSFGYQLFC